MAAPMNFTEIEKKLIFERKKSYILEKFEAIQELSYSEFFKKYLFPNKPCIFIPSVTHHWKSRHEWVLQDNTPNFQLIKSLFGEAIVPVANCGQEQFSSHPKKDILLSEYIDYWEKYRSEGYPEDQECLYLKDWHFTKAYPDYEAYVTPVYFQSDWLNEFWDTLPSDDYRFVYMGPKGTWTPFHADVYRSFSWSANICGKKKWIFYPPGCENMLKDNFGNLVYDVMSSDLDDRKKFPNAHKVKGQMLEVIQGEGQIIFVPSGWHHQVYNLEDTISINHNWLNGCNIDICWKHLQDGLQDVKMEIQHCKDMDGWNAHCQLILKACAGIDYSQFIKMLHVIAENRINQLKVIKGITNTFGTLQTDTGSQNDHDHKFMDGESETSYQIDEDFSFTEMYRALLEMNDCDKRQIKSGDKDCDSCDVKVEKTKNSKVPENFATDKNNQRNETYHICTDKEPKKRSYKNCGNENHEHFVTCGAWSKSEWCESDYLLFDLYRIKQVLLNIISDTDYQNLEMDFDDSAEKILDKIKLYFKL